MRPLDLMVLVLPESTLPLVLVLAGLGMLVGFVPLGRLVRLALLVVLLPVFSLFFEQFFMMLPWHVCLLLFVWLTVALARGALGVVFGKEAAGHILGCAVVSVVRLIGGLGAGLIHLVAWLGFGALRVLIPSTRR